MPFEICFFGFLLFLWGDWFPELFCEGDQRETTYKKVEGQHTLISLLSHHYLIPILYYHQFSDTWPTQKRHKTTGQILGHSVLMQNCRSIHQNSKMYVILYDSCINKKFKYFRKKRKLWIQLLSCLLYWQCLYRKLSSIDYRTYPVLRLPSKTPAFIFGKMAKSNYYDTYFWFSLYS